MPSNSDVIESLKLEIDIGIKGQDKLDSVVSKLNDLSATLEKVNEKLREYASITKGSVKFKMPSITTPATNLPAIQETPTVPVGSVQESSQEIEGATEKIERHAEELKEATKQAKKFGEAIKETGKQTKKAGDDVKKSSSRFGGLLKTFIRIAKYRAIRTVLKEISEGFRTGVQNLARYSSEFNKTMSMFATSSLYLKNGLGTLAQPLLTALIPALSKLIDVCVKVINVFNQMFAVMQGKSTYTRAKKYAVDYAGSLDTATKSSEKLKRSLMGFDEINQLQDNSSGASDGQDYSQMFEEASVDDKIFDFWDKVKASIPTETIENFKKAWERLKEAVEKFGNSKAWRTIKDWLAKITGFALDKLITDFTNGLNVISSMLEFISDPSWETFEQLLQDISKYMAGLFGLQGVELFPHLHSDIELLRTVVELIQTVGNLLKEGLNIDEIKKSIKDIQDRIEMFKNNVKNFGIRGIFKGIGKDTADGLSEGAREAWKDLKEKMHGLIQKFIDWFLERFQINSPSKVFKEIGSNIIAGLANGISEKWSEMWNGIKTKVSNLIKTFTDGVTTIKNNVKSAFSSIWSAISSTMDKIYNKISNIWNSLKSGVKNFVNGIIGGIEHLVNQVIYALNVIVVKARNIINNLPQSVRNALHLDSIFAEQVQYVSIPRYAQGGFPEDGLFMANSQELVGQFSNGRTAVANNMQIEEGIEEAAYRGFSRAMGESNNSGTYTFVAQLNGKTLFKEVVDQNRSEMKSTGTSPLLSY